MPRGNTGPTTGWRIALGFAGLATLSGFYAVLQPRFSGGEGYPDCSTLRADPLGARALFDALRKIPGVQCSRNFERLEKLDGGAGRTLVLLNLDYELFNRAGTRLDGAALAKWAANGGRLVITLDPDVSPGFVNRVIRRAADDDDDDEDDKSAGRKSSGDKASGNGKRDQQAKARSAERKLMFRSPAEVLKLSVTPMKPGLEVTTPLKPVFAKSVPLGPDDAPRWTGASQLVDDPEQDWDSLPSRLTAKDPKKVNQPAETTAPSEGSPWHVIATVRSHPVILERRLGAGSVVVCTDSFFASNEALWSGPKPKFLSWIIGGARGVVFDETHLGTAIGDEDNIMTLARRYRMHGLFIGAFLLFGLYVWRNASSLVPRDESRDLGHWRADAVAGQSAASGLESLLVRGIPRKELLKRCLETWDATPAVADPVPAERRAKARAALAADSDQRDAAGKYRRLRDILHPSRH